MSTPPVLEEVLTEPVDQVLPLVDPEKGHNEWDGSQWVAAPAEPPQEAPYGYLADGVTPRGKPGPKGPRGGTRQATAPPKRPAPKKTAPSSSTSSAKATKKPTRAELLVTLVGAPILAGAVVGKNLLMTAKTADEQNKAVAVLASVGAVAKHAEPLLTGLDQYAAQRPSGWLSKFLDKVTEVGPAAGLALPALALVAQIGVNFGMIPLGLASKLGAVDPHELAQSVLTDLTAQGIG